MQIALSIQGDCLLQVPARNLGRTCWQVGKSLLDIINVGSSSKVGGVKAH